MTFIDLTKEDEISGLYLALNDKTQVIDALVEALERYVRAEECRFHDYSEKDPNSTLNIARAALRMAKGLGS